MAIFTRTLTAAVAATALAGAFTLPAWAQSETTQPSTTVTAPAPHTHAAHGKHHAQVDRAAHMAQHHAQRTAQMKTLLQLQPNQQAAWDKYVQATTPQPRAQRPDAPQDARKLTTLERLDLAQKLRKERNAHAEQRDQATRSFYTSLNASQQQAFDVLTSRGHGKHHAGFGQRNGPERSKHHPHGPRPAAPAM